jgi:hypothetical protein
MKTHLIAALALAASIATAQAVELHAPTLQEQLQQSERETFFECGYNWADDAGQRAAAHMPQQSGWPDSDKVIAFAVQKCALRAQFLTTEQVQAAAREGAETALIKYLPGH